MSEMEQLATGSAELARTGQEVQHVKTTASEALSPGDRLRLSATHQVKIDGLDSWVKVEVDSAVRDGETPKDAIARVGRVIAGNIVNEIERQAEVIVLANKSQ